MRLKRNKSNVITNVYHEDERGREIKMMFVTYFDGCYGVERKENTANTYQMGVCRLDFKDNQLTVYLRRPGLLIGKGGHIINELTNYLGCKVNIVEVNLCNNFGLLCNWQ